jgi:hypothetical protein
VAGAFVQREADRIRVADGLQVPVLHFQEQDAPAWVKDQEVRVLVARADGDVVPTEVVVLEQVAEAGGEAALAGGGPGAGEIGGGEEGGRDGIIFRISGLECSRNHISPRQPRQEVHSAKVARTT